MKVSYLFSTGGKEFAAKFCNRSVHVLKLTVEGPNSTVTHELTVSEAEAVATELMEYVNEIKELALLQKGESA